MCNTEYLRFPTSRSFTGVKYFCYDCWKVFVSVKSSTTRAYPLLIARHATLLQPNGDPPIDPSCLSLEAPVLLEDKRKEALKLLSNLNLPNCQDEQQENSDECDSSQLPIPKEFWWLLAAIYERTKVTSNSCVCSPGTPATSATNNDEVEQPGNLLDRDFRLTDFLTRSGNHRDDGRSFSLSCGNVVAEVESVRECLETGREIPSRDVIQTSTLLMVWGTEEDNCVLGAIAIVAVVLTYRYLVLGCK